MIHICSTSYVRSRLFLIRFFFVLSHHTLCMRLSCFRQDVGCVSHLRYRLTRHTLDGDTLTQIGDIVWHIHAFRHGKVTHKLVVDYYSLGAVFAAAFVPVRYIKIFTRNSTRNPRISRPDLWKKTAGPEIMPPPFSGSRWHMLSISRFS